MINLANAALATMIISAVYTGGDANVEAVNPNEPVNNASSINIQAKTSPSVITCGNAISTLETDGYTNIVTKDCLGSQYRFEAVRNDQNFVVIFAAFSGGMVAIKDDKQELPENKLSLIKTSR